MTTRPEMSDWWPTMWGRLAPGDEVQAPDGSAWTVHSSIVSDGEGEWCIVRDGRDVWSPHREDDPVTARRPLVRAVTPGTPDADLEAGMSVLRSVFGEVVSVPEVAPQPGAGRWLLCGAVVCRCRR